MSSSLGRLLRIRRVFEESSRMELERRVALAMRIEHARDREKLGVREGRKRVLEAVLDESDQADVRGFRRKMELANLEIATTRRDLLQPMLDAAQNRVNEARAAFVERRTERRQVESVIAAEKAQERVEQERRVQRDLDDWFSSKIVRQRRNLFRKESHS